MRACLLIPLLAAFACAGPPPDATVPHVPLGDPVTDARAALSAGDSTYQGVADPELTLPGMTFTFDEVGDERVRVFSRASIGGSAEKWAAQRDSLVEYAAAYNRVVLEARGGEPGGIR